MLPDHVFLSRLLFGFTSLFHILWPVLTIGLSIFLVILEALWLKTQNVAYYHHARFWGKLFALNFGVGIVTGLPLQFELGTNWATFAAVTGDFIGNILGFEASMAFMLEAGFLGIMILGWQRVAPGAHLFATCMVALGASLSAFWIMAANAWLQTPAGGHIEYGRLVIDDYFAAIFNPAMPTSIGHMWLACLQTSLFVIGGISAWYILKNRHSAFFVTTFRLAFFSALLVAPLQIILGDASGTVVAEHQPAKLAALEGHWRTNVPGQGAPWVVLAWPDQQRQENTWAIELPNGLSLLTTRSLTGQVQGLREFARDDQPPVWLPFYAFRVMLLIGFTLLGLTLWTAWAWRKGRLVPAAIGRQKNLLRAWLAAIPLGYIAVDAGWIAREVGRQPWLVQDLLRTEDMASKLPAESVALTLLVVGVVYSALLAFFLIFAWRIIRRGPDLTLPAPGPRSGTLPHSAPHETLRDKRVLGE